VWDRLGCVLDRFEGAWKSGRRPDLDGYLATAQAERLALLVEMVHADLDYRLRAGEEARGETYLERYPELRGDREATLNLIAAEYALRQRREPGGDPGEYLRRFPEYRDELPVRLQTPPGDVGVAGCGGVEGVGPGAAPPDAPVGPAGEAPGGS